MTDAATTTTAATTATTAAATTATATTTAAPPWHSGQLDTDVIGYLTNKGLDVNDPAKLALGIIPQYRNIEKLVGVKPEELVRWPKDVGDSDNWNNVYTRLGVPKEAKDYDLSGVKFSDGKELDSGFTDAVRAAFHDAKVPKEAAPAITAKLVKFMEEQDKADLADVTAKINAERTALEKNWGTKREYNMVMAKAALEKVGTASGLTPEQIKQGWDALSNVGGIGASYAMQMLLTISSRMGEAPFIGGDRTSDPAKMTREGAAAEIEELKKDTAFGAKFKAGDREAKKLWENLHSIAYGQAA